VRTIYSVIASPNRLDILRILNTKGPLSYSELKTLAGFKSKKESGKFAYHLRKLVKQTLISLNRGERKYAVTSLGRLVLNLTKQIEEQSMLESGRLYVRSSRQAMEEFNADKILQSLVKEAEMPVELAQKIASETEARVYKFQAAYLTAPLIREVVNSILVEHGFEEYRHKLTRLGLPVHDVADLIAKTADGYGSVSSLFLETSRKVFSEFSLLTKIPRDVADAHLSGDIHLSSIGTWSLVPDTLLFDLAAFNSGSPILGSKLTRVPRLGHVKSLDSAIKNLVVLSGILSSELSNEVCFDNIVPYLAKFYSPRSSEDQARVFSWMFDSLAAATLGGSSVTFRIGEPNRDEDVSGQLEIRDAILSGYARFVESVPKTNLNLVVSPGSYLDRKMAESISHIVNAGGDIALESEGKYSFNGLRFDNLAFSKVAGSSSEIELGSGGKAAPDGIAVLQNLTINLPRLAYESNRDETYFRAKLAIILGTALSALLTRREQVRDMMKRGLLPALTQLPVFTPIDDMPLVINLAGLNDAISNLIPEQESSPSRKEISLKILDTAAKVSAEKGSKAGQRAFVSLLDLKGVDRLSELDSEKYGRSHELRSHSYQHGLSILTDHFDNDLVLQDLADISRAANGGALLSFEFPKTEEANVNVANMVTGISGKLPFVRFSRGPQICRKCGAKSFNAARCLSCKSTAFVLQSSLE
jgi:anaerobic ribonucleoside-triphosphate reductase